VAVLKDALEAIVDLTDTTARFIMTDKLSGTKVVDADATVVDPTNGIVQYQWVTGDTDVASSYKAEFEVAWGDGTFETFPNSKYIAVKVVPDLGGIVG
jgi:hypothetical protein